MFETRMMIQHVLFVPNRLREIVNTNLHTFLTWDIPEVPHILAKHKTKKPEITYMITRLSQAFQSTLTKSSPSCSWTFCCWREPPALTNKIWKLILHFGPHLESDSAMSRITWNLTPHCGPQPGI